MYRYWTHILQKEGIVLAPHPKFSSWSAAGNADFVFTIKQKAAWTLSHFKAYHWYIEMNSKETPPNKEETRQNVEPSFVAPTPIVPATDDATDVK